MKRAPGIVAIIGLLIGVAGLFYGWRERVTRESVERSLADVLAKRSEPAAPKQRDAEAPAEELPQSAALPALVDDTEIVRRFQQNLAKQRAKEAMAGAAAQERLMESREIQEEIVRQFRLNLRLRYGAFFSDRSLSETQIAAFENAMLEKFWTMSNVLIATRKAGSSDQEAAEVRRQQLAASDDKLRTALGDGLHRSYIQYDMTADARGLVETLAGKLFHGEPLSSTQGTRLAELLTSNASTNRPDEWLRRQAFAGESNIITWTDVDWEAVLGRAGEILTPSQLFTLRALASDARLRRDIEQRLREADQRGRDSVRGRKPG